MGPIHRLHLRVPSPLLPRSRRRPNRLTVVYSGIDLERFRPKAGRARGHAADRRRRPARRDPRLRRPRPGVPPPEPTRGRIPMRDRGGRARRGGAARADRPPRARGSGAAERGGRTRGRAARDAAVGTGGRAAVRPRPLGGHGRPAPDPDRGDGRRGPRRLDAARGDPRPGARGRRRGPWSSRTTSRPWRSRWGRCSTNWAGPRGESALGRWRWSRAYFGREISTRRLARLFQWAASHPGPSPPDPDLRFPPAPGSSAEYEPGMREPLTQLVRPGAGVAAGSPARRTGLTSHHRPGPVAPRASPPSQPGPEKAGDSPGIMVETRLGRDYRSVRGTDGNQAEATGMNSGICKIVAGRGWR